MSNKKSLISDCSEYACKWIQKISQHSEDCEDEKYTLERLNAIKACAEFEIKLLGQKKIKTSLEITGDGSGKKLPVYTNHKPSLPLKYSELKYSELDKDIMQ